MKKGHEPSQAEKPSAQAMARASSARTHHYLLALTKHRKLPGNKKLFDWQTLTSRINGKVVDFGYVNPLTK